MEPTVTVGVDLGQKVDPTAIVVTQAHQPAGYRDVRYSVREFGRLPLGTQYPAVYRAVVQVLDGLAALGIRKPTVIVDATGATAAVDGLRVEVQGRCRLVAATFTHGDRLIAEPYGFDTASVGKAYLVNLLQVLIQSGRLELPPNKPEAAAMMRELQDYEIHIDQDANDKYGAFKVGSHDDLVTALGLSVLKVRSTRQYVDHHDAVSWTSYT